jgi:ABC-2 type transport system ATP-binding protein
VLVDGLDAVREPLEARARMGGLIEVPGFHPMLDGSANLRLLARLQGMDGRRTGAEVARLMKLVGLGHAGSKHVHAYSHGMRQRLGIAQALLGRPAYVLLDEPTNGLDPEGIAEIREVLRRLTREEGVSVLISSHQLHEIADVCTRIGVLKGGRLMVEAPTRELLASSSGRHVVSTDRNAEAGRILQGLGVAFETGAEGLTFDPGQLEPAAIARSLVEAGLGLERFGPRPATLEEIYLSASAQTRAAQPRAGAEDETPEQPGPRRAPGRALLRMARYELVRWTGHGFTPAMMLLSPALAALAVFLLHRRAAANEALVEAGERFSTTEVTAFEGFGVGLRAGLMLFSWVVAGLASQAIAGELARGTLRNVLLRPLRRIHVVVGKALALLVMFAGTYLALVLAALVAAGLAFEFNGVAEILPNGERFELEGFTPSDLWPLLREATLQPLLPLAAACGIGFLAGALARSAAGALALSLSALVTLDLARTVARGLDFEAYLPTAYLPSPLGDTSFMNFYVDSSQGVSNTSFPYADTSLVVPLGWCLFAFGLSTLILRRRSVP